MLLKTHYEPQSPDSESSGSTVEQHHDDESVSGAVRPRKVNGAALGGSSKASGKGHDVIFKSSPALDAIDIPEPRARRRTTGIVAAVPASPPAPPSAYRWPAAFVLAAAIVVGGALVYKKTMVAKPAEAGSTVAAARVPAVSEVKAATATSGGPHLGSPTKKPIPEGAGVAASSAAAGAKQPDKDKAVVASSAATDGVDKKTRSKKSGENSRRSGPRRSASAVRDRSQKSAARVSATKVTAPKAAAVKVAAKAPAAKAASGKKGGDELDSLIDNALGGDASKARKAPKKVSKSSSGLPKSLSRDQVQVAMRSIKSLVGACYDKYQKEGTVKVRLTVGRKGRASAAKVRGKFVGTDTGRCVAKAVRRARFPKFSGSPLTFTYPFTLSD